MNISEIMVLISGIYRRLRPEILAFFKVYYKVKYSFIIGCIGIQWGTSKFSCGGVYWAKKKKIHIH